MSVDGDEEDGTFLELRWRNSKVTVSLLPNQAAQPPVSRMSVPSCPFQNPRRPWCLKTSRMTAIGVGERCTMPSVLALAGTWILHFTSSTGVRTRLVNAPDMAPVSQSAESGSGFSRWYRPAVKNASRATRSQKKREDVSRAAPTRGADMPR